MDNDPNNYEGDNDPNADSRLDPMATSNLGETTADVSDDVQEAMEAYDAAERMTEASEGPVVKGEMLLRIEVRGSSTPLVLALTNRMHIGRRDPTTGESPELDLTPYEAYQLGISRRHAVILIENQRLRIRDLGSRNGTYLNGRKLHPDQSTPLRDGDELRLGKIVLNIYLHQR
jgi:hypothetical protein